MKLQIWRSKDSGATWEPKLDYIGVEVLPDCCGIRFDAAGRDPKNPWTWNGDTTTPVVYDIMVTMAVETMEPLDATIDLAGGTRAREYFMDAGNLYRAASRVNCILPANVSNKPTASAPSAGNEVKQFGTKAAPDVFIDETGAIEADLAYRMHLKNAECISGSLVLHSLRVSPMPVGYLVGDLTVETEEGQVRQTMNVNACIRAARFDRASNETTLTLDGR